ncbi:MAG: peptide ABC transporter substrate-binding protein [bacterium]|nr:peptide ABC transporter substrate-binding protein [bacterium]
MIEKPHILKRHFHIPFFRQLENAVHSFSHTGKLVFYILTIIFAVSSGVMLWKVNTHFLVEVPEGGGTLIEGVIGLPRFINPVLAVTDGDKDLVALVYSGLMRVMPDGTIVPDIAESYTISPDGKTYTFTIKPNASFHDESTVTADDIIFTIQKIQDPLIKSNKKANWDGITVNKIDARTVQFVLTQAYAPFLENAVLGILPMHVWQNLDAEGFITSDMNVHPVGSGPFKIVSIDRNDNGVPLQAELERFTSFSLGSPLLKKVVIRFYTTEKNLVEAYEDGSIQSLNSISPDTAIEFKRLGAKVLQSELPRTFALFFNQSNNAVLAQKEVRQALSLGVDRSYITNTILQGFGSPLDSAVPKSFTSTTHSLASSTNWHISHSNEAIQLLENNGWKTNESGIREKEIGKDKVPLSFSISTTDAPELKEIAERLKMEWQKIGADVSVKVVEGGNLNQSIIKPRKYDALLFGQVVNRNLDLYAFWHSSQRTDPGLNVALYSNKTADAFVENMRTLTNKEERFLEYTKFDAELQKDIPALFLYAPHFIYVVPPNLYNNAINQIAVPSERFGNIHTWYTNTEKIWKIFINK